MPGSLIAGNVLGMVTTAGALTPWGLVTAFAINMVASSIISKAFAPDSNQNFAQDQQNPGSRAQVPPAGSNKLPVLYGSAFIGGTIVDLSITSDNQQLYYVLALSEVTGSENGGTGDVYTFGDVYWGGKKVIFNSTNQYVVDSLYDESTGLYDTSVAGKLEIYKYRNGSNTPVNSSLTAIQVMQSSGLVYTWDSTKLMSNCAFAIVKITYSQDASLTGIQQTKFQLTNPRFAPGDCFLDYFASERYGAAIPLASIDTASLTALNTYCSGSFTYTPYSGGSTTQTRFRFDGTLETNQKIMTNLQILATNCDCLIKYNEITGKWGVIVQSPTYSITANLDDSDIISGIQVTPIDIASSFNIAEVNFPDGTAKDSFNSSTFDLSVINPSLMYPNEPVNKQTINLPLVNNDVRAQYLANRFLESAREDLQIKLSVNFVGIQYEAGDIVTLTNANYGWVSKLFRVSQVIENFGSDGSITVSLTLMEYNPLVYDDVNITQFTPAPNTGIGSPTFFGTIAAPTISSSSPSATVPSFVVGVTTSSSGIVQYAEVWYSAYANPSSAQLMFAGTTAIQPNGAPYAPNTALTVTLTNIAAGNWYFFTRMVNQLGVSVYSPASTVFQWRPTTFAYSQRYLIVSYADSITGTGMNALPTGKSYYGLLSSNSTTYSTTPSDYTWFAASPTFNASNKLCFINRTGRLFSFGVAPAGYAAGTASYVPTSTFDDTIWSALPDGTNWIDLDLRTGQLTRTGTTSTGGGQLSIVNNPNGTLVGQLQQFLTFAGGASTYTSNVANLTIDIYGRVVGLVPPDTFYYTSNDFVATAGQTVFTPPARQAGYITGQDMVFRNGVLLDTTEYSETSTTVTMNTACVVNERVAIISFRSVNANAIYYEALGMTYSSGTGTTTCTYTNLPYQNITAGDKLTFSNAGTPTQYTVSSINYVTKQIVFTAAFTATTGASIYRARAANAAYPSFSRWTVALSSASSVTPTTFQLYSGAELLFLNGGLVNDQDYDLVGGAITNFPAVATGNMTIFQFANSNLGVPNGSPAIVSTNTVNGQTVYNFSYDPAAFELYNTGILQVAGVDYTTGSGTYTLSTTPTYSTNILSQQTFNRTGAA